MSTPRTHFELFGLDARFAVDASELERRYRELSRALHPDRQTGASARERLAAVSRTTDLNEAYRVLRDEQRRAEYLLKLEGFDVGEERPASLTGGADRRVRVAPAVLMEVMERNEALAEARAERDDARVEALGAEVEAARQAAWRRLRQGFTSLPVRGSGVAAPVDEGARQQLLGALAQELILLRYHARFVEQLEAYEEERQARSSGAHS